MTALAFGLSAALYAHAHRRARRLPIPSVVPAGPMSHVRRIPR